MASLVQTLDRVAALRNRRSATNELATYSADKRDLESSLMSGDKLVQHGFGQDAQDLYSTAWQTSSIPKDKQYANTLTVVYKNECSRNLMQKNWLTAEQYALKELTLLQQMKAGEKRDSELAAAVEMLKEIQTRKSLSNEKNEML